MIWKIFRTPWYWRGDQCIALSWEEMINTQWRKLWCTVSLCFAGSGIPSLMPWAYRQRALWFGLLASFAPLGLVSMEQLHRLQCDSKGVTWACNERRKKRCNSVMQRLVINRICHKFERPTAVCFACHFSEGFGEVLFVQTMMYLLNVSTDFFPFFFWSDLGQRLYGR